MKFKAAVRDNYEQCWTDEQCVDWAVLFIEEVGATATFAGMEDWMRHRAADGAPSGQSIRNYRGLWSDVLEFERRRRWETAMTSAKEQYLSRAVGTLQGTFPRLASDQPAPRVPRRRPGEAGPVRLG